MRGGCIALVVAALTSRMDSISISFIVGIGVKSPHLQEFTPPPSRGLCYLLQRGRGPLGPLGSSSSQHRRTLELPT
ncbi:hypothetical protein T484DRAFT_1964673 [Baffinella frigidus]|nr:hypothetical protein T484DRAFT_1964673 [Cryptophyta sp. CCMP2293]